MKYVKTFEEFINEKYNGLSEAVDWKKGQDYPAYGRATKVVKKGDKQIVTFKDGNTYTFALSGDNWVEESFANEASKSPSPREYKHISGKENKIKLAIKDVEKTARLKINRGKEPEYEQLSLNKIMLSKVLGREKLGKEHVKAWKKLMKEYDLKESFVNEGAYSLLNFFQEMQSFDAAGVTTDDIKRASEPKNIKKTEKNNRELKSLLRDWSNGTYDEDPDALVRELRYLLESANEAMDNYSDDAHTIADEFMSQYSNRDKVDLEEWEQFIYDTFIMNPGDGPQLDNEEIDKYTMDDILNILGDNRYNKVDMDEIGAAYESVLTEKSSGDNALLQKMFKALKRSKNFSSIKMGKPYDQDDWDGATINIMSKLKGEDDRHKDDFDEFEIGIDIDGGIVMVYAPSGNDTEIDSVADVMKLTRANEGYVSEAKNDKHIDKIWSIWDKHFGGERNPDFIEQGHNWKRWVLDIYDDEMSSKELKHMQMFYKEAKAYLKKNRVDFKDNGNQLEISEAIESIAEGTTPTFKRLIKMAKSNGIETVDELDDLIQDEFSDAEPHISGADYEIAKKKLRLTESSTLKTYEEFINEAKVMSKKDIDKLVKELVADGRHGDDAAFDIADGILFDEEGLEAGIKKHYRVSDVQGWLADRIA